MFNMTTRFCDAYASWQQGGAEDANGRLRRWLPRQLDIDKLDEDKLQDIVFNAKAGSPWLLDVVAPLARYNVSRCATRLTRKKIFDILQVINSCRWFKNDCNF